MLNKLLLLVLILLWSCNDSNKAELFASTDNNKNSLFSKNTFQGVVRDDKDLGIHLKVSLQAPLKNAVVKSKQALESNYLNYKINLAFNDTDVITTITRNTFVSVLSRQKADLRQGIYIMQGKDTIPYFDLYIPIQTEFQKSIEFLAAFDKTTFKTNESYDLIIDKVLTGFKDNTIIHYN